MAIIAEASTIELNEGDFKKIKQLGSKKYFSQDEIIFSEGDVADYIYFICSGEVSIKIQKFTRLEEICRLGVGSHFGEMAFFSGDMRSASATAISDVSVYMVDQKTFIAALRSDESLSKKVNALIEIRNRDLASKENIYSDFHDDKHRLQIGIKGDPSLRESAFFRERYKSVVDNILPELQTSLTDLLLNRNVCQVMIHFNSGEVLIKTIFDPFTHEIHPAAKLISRSYIDRHFPKIEYKDKTAMIKNLYGAVARDKLIKKMPAKIQTQLQKNHHEWHALKPEEIKNTISKLGLLRNIPDFYLRNFTMDMIRDSIRIQFNCDGTHILDAEGYQDFLAQNLTQE